MLAIPMFASSKEKSYTAVMKGDLRNLVLAQEAYFAANITYYDGAVPSAQLAYDPSPGVGITLSSVTPGGWAAASDHSQTTKTCAIFLGAAPATAPAVVEGQVKCTT